jgi:Transposase and inactivated derivatives
MFTFFFFLLHKSFFFFYLLTNLIDFTVQYSIPATHSYPFTHPIFKMLSDEQRGGIIAGYHLGSPCRTIAKVVGCHHSTVARFLLLYNNKNVNNVPKKTKKKASNPVGRPPLISKARLKNLKQFVTTKRRRFLSSNELRIEWEKREGYQLHTKTLVRAINKAGLHSRVARRKPLLTDENKAKRLTWCLEHQNWSPAKWRRVYWTDEKFFTQFRTHSHMRVWRKQGVGQEFDSNCVAAKVSKSVGKMVWAGFSWKGLGPLVTHNGKVTGKVHSNLLKDHAIPSFQSQFPRENGFFQQDNARVHTAKVAQEELIKENINILPWPARSPDLNPIENLWFMIENNLRKRRPFPTNLAQLEKMIRDEWGALPLKFLRHLVDSLPRRVNAVVEAEGGVTKY